MEKNYNIVLNFESIMVYEIPTKEFYNILNENYYCYKKNKELEKKSNF